VLLLDQRGTGRSTPATRLTLAGRPGPQAQADYLARFRADNIVRDAEHIRRRLTGGAPWSLLGQSFGGFCTVTYLSLAPEGVTEAFITGGLPGLDVTADDVYRAAYPRVAAKVAQHYERYPEDVDRARQIARHLATHAADVFGLRDRGRITPGQAADLCVIVPPGLTEQATYADPARLATGVSLVLVNGTITWRDGAPVPGVTPGRLVS